MVFKWFLNGFLNCFLNGRVFGSLIVGSRTSTKDTIEYCAYHHIRVDSQLLLNFMYKRKALWTGSVARRLATTPKIGREAPRDDDFSIIAKKHFFNNFQHF